MIPPDFAPRNPPPRSVSMSLRSLFNLRLPALRRLACAGLVLAAGVAAAGAEPTLTLDEAIKLALEKNPQIKVQAFGRSIARADLLTAIGKFDPSLNFRRSYSESEAPYGVNPFIGQIVKSDNYSLTVDGVTPWGLQFSFGGSATNQRGTFINNGSPSAFATYGGVTITQPLLRGFGFSTNFLGVRIARANKSISDWQFRQTAIDTVTSVINAYTNLMFAQEQLRIAERSRELAAGLLDENEKRFKVGSMSESDVTQARARTATRDESILQARQGVSDATNRLRQLMGETTFPIEPNKFNLAAPEDTEITVNPRKDLETAYELRPDYQAAKLGLVIRRANDASARNQLLPQVDFIGSYGYNGLDPNFSASRRMVLDRDNHSYSAGIVVSVPFTFAEGRGRARSARLQLHQSEADLSRLEQDIAVAVSHAAGELDTTKKRVAANKAALDLAKQALDGEVKKLRAGTSSTFFVLNLQEQLIFAELSYQGALTDQLRARAAYDQTLGRTLLVHHIELDK